MADAKDKGEARNTFTAEQSAANYAWFVKNYPAYEKEHTERKALSKMLTAIQAAKPGGKPITSVNTLQNMRNRMRKGSQPAPEAPTSAIFQIVVAKDATPPEIDHEKLHEALTLAPDTVATLEGSTLLITKDTRWSLADCREYYEFYTKKGDTEALADLPRRSGRSVDELKDTTTDTAEPSN